MAQRFSEAALNLPPRVEDNLILYSDIWHSCLQQQPANPNREVEVIDSDGKTHRAKFDAAGRWRDSKTGLPLVKGARPAIWRYTSAKM
jgi:hypothetical protein